MFYLALVLILFIGCEFKTKSNKTLKNGSIEHTPKRDTIFSSEISAELKTNLDNNHSLEKLKFLDQNNQKLLSFSEDTILLRVLYHSEKFPLLNDSYEIDIDPVSENMTVLDRLGRNKFKLLIEPNPDTIIFDINLSSKKFIFKESYVDSNKKIRHKIVPEIFLSRKTLIIR